MLPSDGKTTSTLELNLKFEGATRLSPLMAVTWVGPIFFAFVALFVVLYRESPAEIFVTQGEGRGGWVQAEHWLF